MKLNLERPLVFFDLETTGLNVGKDKIVEISLLKVMPDGEEVTHTMLINPGCHIPIECSEVHGIYDKDVADKPKLEELGDGILKFFGDAVLAEFNSKKFDFPLRVENFLLWGRRLDSRNRRCIDVQNIFHKMEPRNLVAAYKLYCGKDLNDAHQAEADTKATYEVLKAQLDKYQNQEYEDRRTGVKSVPIQNDVKALSSFSSETRMVDFAGHIVFNERDEEVFNFGKHKGETVENVFRKEPSYYAWMMNADFPLYTKEIITKIKERMF
ncbi:MAG: DNA polymerase III subunit epsilon [Bacteroidetes bacterium]|nr:DNA polymerase III subunit epsilon [Bacteroidota bacterium]